MRRPRFFFRTGISEANCVSFFDLQRYFNQLSFCSFNRMFLTFDRFLNNNS
jgi:hypothetical protein